MWMYFAEPEWTNVDIHWSTWIPSHGICACMLTYRCIECTWYCNNCNRAFALQMQCFFNSLDEPRRRALISSPYSRHREKCVLLFQGPFGKGTSATNVPPCSIMAPRPELTGFDIRKLARLSAKDVKDPWARGYESLLPVTQRKGSFQLMIVWQQQSYREAWRYTGPFTRYNRFKGAFPGLGIATVAFTAYCAYEYLFLSSSGNQHGHTEAGHGEAHNWHLFFWWSSGIRKAARKSWLRCTEYVN